MLDFAQPPLFTMSAQPFSTVLCQEINLLRSNPSAYAQYVSEHKARFVDDLIYKKPNGNKIRTKEGIKNVQATIDLLYQTQPLPPLQACGELESAALDHANDTEINNLVGHVGTDGSSTSNRILKYGIWDIKIGENLRYGNEEPRDIVVGWLVDDNKPGRGHRNNILQSDFALMGAAIGGHDVHGVCCVCTFAHSFRPPDLNAPVIVPTYNPRPTVPYPTAPPAPHLAPPPLPPVATNTASAVAPLRMPQDSPRIVGAPVPQTPQIAIPQTPQLGVPQTPQVRPPGAPFPPVPQTPQVPGSQTAMSMAPIPQTPHGVPQTPQVRPLGAPLPSIPQTPQGVPQTPQGVAQIPPGVPQTPQGVPQTPQIAIPQTPQAQSQASPIPQVSQTPQSTNLTSMTNCVLKFDHFENIHRLKETLITTDAPNFRKVNGFNVFGTGQPTLVAFGEAVTFIRDKLNMKQILWTNMRQEPVVYANGLSFTPRESTRLNENMEFPGVTGAVLEKLQSDFVAVLKGRAAPGLADEGKCRYFKDTYAEHPEDRKNIEYVVPLEGERPLLTLGEVYDNLKAAGFDLKYVRAPIVDEKAPSEGDFDVITAALVDEPNDTACIFNCQMGKGRTTTGMIIACLVKRFLYGAGEEVLAAPYEEPKSFKVIDKLIEKLPAAQAAKQILNRIIDLCGEPPVGTGLQNLRDCILWTKDKFNAEPDHKKPFWKHMSVNFIERYFYLICYATYVMEEGPANKLKGKTFSAWMGEHPELRTHIQEGMAEFQWE